ncbi:MAG: MerR family regulatory protein [Chloroflexota bacterium]|nr:MerR family regulatory protein [Chloroflexota bacterium]
MRRLMGLTGLTRRELEVIDEATLASLALGEVNEQVVWRVRRVRRLRRDLGLDYASIEIIVRLLDRVEELERRQV